VVTVAPRMVGLEDAVAGELESMAIHETTETITHCCGSLQKLARYAAGFAASW
jgi:hypothetical protein